jgi:hypothetical protein
MAMQQHQYNDDPSGGLIINIVPELSRRIRRAAAQSNLPVQEYVGQILEQVVPPETNDAQKSSGRLDPAAVDKLLQTREKIMRAHPGLVFEDAAETLRQIREERMRELEQR